MTKKKKPYSPPLTPNQKIKLHIKEKNNIIIESLRCENNCNHEWIRWGHGYKCENCDYYSGMDLRLNQLINKSLKK